MAKRKVPQKVFHVDECGKEKIAEIIHEELGSGYSADWSIPQSVGQKGDEKFVGDSLLIVPESKEALEIMYGGANFSKHGSSTPLGELSLRFTNEVHEVGRVFIDITPHKSV